MDITAVGDDDFPGHRPSGAAGQPDPTSWCRDTGIPGWLGCRCALCRPDLITTGSVTAPATVIWTSPAATSTMTVAWPVTGHYWIWS